MWQRTFAAAILAAGVSSYCYAQAPEDVQGQIAWCAKDTGSPDCPVTYQALRASDCLRTNENRSCLIRMAKEAAAAGNCSRAYQLVYACQCGTSHEPARDAIKAAGEESVCKYLRAG